MSHTVTSDSGLLSRKVIPGHSVQVKHRATAENARPESSSPKKAEDRPNEPKIKLQRENGVVKAIEIECTCGEVIHLDCEY